MADNKSSEETKPEEVTLTNVSRRPLLVRLPGKTLRLGPGERQIVPKSLLATTEVLRMCEQRFVTVGAISEPQVQVAPPKPKAPTPPSKEISESPAPPKKEPEMEGAAAEGVAAEEAPAGEVAAADTESDAAGSNPKTPAGVETNPPKQSEGKKANKGKNLS